MDENQESEGESGSEGGHCRLVVSEESWNPSRATKMSPKKLLTNIRPNNSSKRKPRSQVWNSSETPTPNMTPDPLTTDKLTVLRPARTYERQRTPRPPAPPVGVSPVKPAAETQCGDFTLDNHPDQNSESDFEGPGDQILHHQNCVPNSQHVERTGTTGLVLRAPRAQLQHWSPDLNCQLARLEQAAETGNAGALLLLEQIRAYGKPRHHFSKRLLVTCARWRKRYCLAYSHARKTQLFTLPSATTLNKRCLPRPISTMGPDSTANVLFDIRPYRYKSGQRFQTKLSMW